MLRNRRLVAVHEDYRFLDFDALGVQVHVNVMRRTPGTTATFAPLVDFWSDDGGLEHGYQASD